MAAFDGETARWVQNHDGIEISKTHFISREGAKLHGYATFWYKCGGGKHLDVVRLEGTYYLTQPTIKPYPEPIPYSKSSKDSHGQ